MITEFDSITKILHLMRFKKTNVSSMQLLLDLHDTSLDVHITSECVFFCLFIFLIPICCQKVGGIFYD